MNVTALLLQVLTINSTYASALLVIRDISTCIMGIKMFLLMALMLSGCGEKELHPLGITKREYIGNELRIDGYYYSTLTTANDIGVAVFYRDGVCLHNFTRVQSQDTFNVIENEILRNSALMSSFWTTPTHIGVFHINDRLLGFETWEAAYDITTFSHFCEIINDTTFLMTRRTNNEINKSFSEKLTYRFKQFSPKPDSTNNFIK